MPLMPPEKGSYCLFLVSVKCDERANTCLNCEKAALCCPGYPETPEALSTATRRLVRPTGEQLKHHTVSGVKRRRLMEACLECRRQKERCSADKPTCARCKRTGKQCSYQSEQTPQVERGGTRRPSSSTPGRNGIETNYVNHQPEKGNGESSSSTVAVTDSTGEGDFLPPRDTIVRLWQVFFLHISPLQCFGFIHRPTLLEELDRLPRERSIDTTLWLSICVLSTTAVKFDTEFDDTEDWEHKGALWFKQAYHDLMCEIPAVTIKKLTCLVLLLEYCLRREDYPKAFLIAGTTARITQALQLNLERGDGPPCTDQGSRRPHVLENEIRRRLMWACFLADANMASGVDQLKLIKLEDIKIQLPTHDYNFLHQVPAVTEHLARDTHIEVLPNPPRPQEISRPSNLGIQAFFIRMRSIKSKILRYIKRLSEHLPPWHENSLFVILAKELDELRLQLPESLQYTPISIRLYQGSAELAALFSLHLGIDQCYCDLYRLTIPQVCFPADSTQHLLAEAPPGFVSTVRDKILSHSQRQSAMLGDMIRLQDESAFVDWGIGIHAHESVKYQAIYVMTTAYSNEESRMAAIIEITPGLEDCLRVLQKLTKYYESIGTKYLLSLFKLLLEYGFPVGMLTKHLSRTQYAEVGSGYNAGASDTSPSSSSPSHATADTTLHPLSVFALVRSCLEPTEKNMAETRSPSQGNVLNPHTSRDGSGSYMNNIPSELSSTLGGAYEVVPDDFTTLLDGFNFPHLVFPGDYGTFLDIAGTQV
ncbi:hypothetical protein FQN54_005372 [Arachnomyces sp. PD_36]|nr:hypothetical protein FQN54_005372 [Arachnomyces sp. PD_36]